MPASLSQGCPDEETLLAFSEGRLADEALEAMVRHLEVCDRCLAGMGAASAPASSVRGRPSAFRPGDRVAGRYEIRRFIARGGMGEVYEAHDALVGTRLALKTVVLASADDPRAVELMRREVRLARAISHRGVCRVFDLGEHVIERGGQPVERLLFLTMEFLDGSTLGDQIRSSGRLPLGVVLPIARQLTAALGAAHEAGIVHRDLKSDNIMWLAGAPGSSPRVVVMDFGLARLGSGVGGVSSAGGMLIGSVGYMAPEQVQGGPITAAADIYALGVVLFEAVTARLPFVGDTPLGTALMRLRQDPPAPSTLAPEVHRGLEAVIMKCLARKPSARFASMAEVGAALEALDRTVAVPAPVRGRRKALWFGAVGLAAASLAAAGVLLARRSLRETAHEAPRSRPVATDRQRVSPDPGGAPSRSAATLPDASMSAPGVLPSPSGLAEPSAAASAGAASLTPASRVPGSRRTGQRLLGRRTAVGPASTATPDAGRSTASEPPRPVRDGKSNSSLDGFADPFN